MGARRWVEGPFVFVSEDKAEKLNANKARPGDLVFTQRGTLGQVAMVPTHPFSQYIVSQSQMKLTVDSTKADAMFVYYLFQSSGQQAYIRNNAVQTGVPHTNLGTLRNTPIRLPPLTEQNAICRTLSALDSRIDSKILESKTLESIARAIFKSWFVDFDPVQAKAEGREPEGMDAATAALFPSEFVESGFVSLPNGWTVGTLADCVIFHNSSRIPISSADRSKRPGPFPYYGAAGPIDSVDHFLFDGEYVLVGEDGSVIDQRGKPVIQHVWGKFWVSNHAHVLEPKGGWSIAAIRHLLGAVDIGPYVTGAVQPKLSMTNLKRVPVVSPTQTLLEVYAAKTESLVARERLNIEEIRTLAELRDILLPRLISGKLRVPEAEKLVEAAL